MSCVYDNTSTKDRRASAQCTNRSDNDDNNKCSDPTGYWALARTIVTIGGGVKIVVQGTTPTYTLPPPGTIRNFRNF